MSQHQGIAGQELTLYDGSRVWVRAASAFAGEDLGSLVLLWLQELAPSLPVDPAATLDLSNRPERHPALIAWILATSDPERGIDPNWCRTHLHVSEVGAILAAWAGGTSVTPLLAALNRVSETLHEAVKAFAFLRASAQATAGPVPGEVTQ